MEQFPLPRREGKGKREKEEEMGIIVGFRAAGFLKVRTLDLSSPFPFSFSLLTWPNGPFLPPRLR
jgi:hypothetical protein